MNRFATSQKQVIIGPKILILVLNRGKSDTNSYSSRNYGYRSYSYGSTKYNHTVKFGENLQFRCGDKYDLRSVCNHSGYSAKGGHYTADVKQLGTDEWHHCNDSSVSKAGRYSRSSGFNCKDAIMMLFNKI